VKSAKRPALTEDLTKLESIYGLSLNLKRHLLFILSLCFDWSSDLDRLDARVGEDANDDI